MPNEPWYESVSADTPITQGDLIFNCLYFHGLLRILIRRAAKKMKYLKAQHWQFPLMTISILSCPTLHRILHQLLDIKFYCTVV